MTLPYATAPLFDDAHFEMLSDDREIELRLREIAGVIEPWALRGVARCDSPVVPPEIAWSVRAIDRPDPIGELFLGMAHPRCEGLELGARWRGTSLGRLLPGGPTQRKQILGGVEAAADLIVGRRDAWWSPAWRVGDEHQGHYLQFMDISPTDPTLSRSQVVDLQILIRGRSERRRDATAIELVSRFAPSDLSGRNAQQIVERIAPAAVWLTWVLDELGRPTVDRPRRLHEIERFRTILSHTSDEPAGVFPDNTSPFARIEYGLLAPWTAEMGLGLGTTTWRDIVQSNLVALRRDPKIGLGGIREIARWLTANSDNRVYKK